VRAVRLDRAAVVDAAHDRHAAVVDVLEAGIVVVAAVARDTDPVFLRLLELSAFVADALERALVDHRQLIIEGAEADVGADRALGGVHLFLGAAPGGAGLGLGCEGEEAGH
jgi:hypothetical protein